MTGIQIHHPCWEIHIVVTPCHQAKSLQGTTSSFIFILIIMPVQLDLSWNTIQQVRIHAKYYVLVKGLEILGNWGIYYCILVKN